MDLEPARASQLDVRAMPTVGGTTAADLLAWFDDLRAGRNLRDAWRRRDD